VPPRVLCHVESAALLCLAPPNLIASFFSFVSSRQATPPPPSQCASCRRNRITSSFLNLASQNRVGTFLSPHPSRAITFVSSHPSRAVAFVSPRQVASSIVPLSHFVSLRPFRRNHAVTSFAFHSRRIASQLSFQRTKLYHHYRHPMLCHHVSSCRIATAIMRVSTLRLTPSFSLFLSLSLSEPSRATTYVLTGQAVPQLSSHLLKLPHHFCFLRVESNPDIVCALIPRIRAVSFLSSLQIAPPLFPLTARIRATSVVASPWVTSPLVLSRRTETTP
jgi:hypothetical protein